MTRILNILERKKRGEILAEGDIRFWVEGLTKGEIPDYQSAALLMAIRLNGMDFPETLALTKAMADSGARLSFPEHAVVYDKHSTGGVGDKVTLILTPLLAACGLPVVMLSGRGLGFTGGTIDKFEALPGLSTRRSPDEMRAMLQTCGWANAQATEAIAPADRILYALRDVTATVDSVPLITASILSKKLAGGASHLCMDVKCGSSAFMSRPEAARELAGNLKTIGGMGGLNVSGFLTRMEEPLGHAIGNYLELLESVFYLREPHETPLMELIHGLAADMLVDAGLVADSASAHAAVLSKIQDGSGLARLLDYLKFNGGEPAAIEKLLVDRYENYPRVAAKATSSGYLQAVHGRQVGELMVDLGAGRAQVSDTIDPIAGCVMVKHVGDAVASGETIAWLYGARALEKPEAGIQAYLATLQIGAAQPAKQPMILEAI